MKKRVLSLYIPDTDYEDYADGTIYTDEAFSTFSVSLPSFYDRNNLDVYDKLKSNVESFIYFSTHMNPDMDFTSEQKFLDDMNNMSSDAFFDTFDEVVITGVDNDFIKNVVEKELDFFKHKKIILDTFYGMTEKDVEKAKKDIEEMKSLVEGWDPEVLLKVSGNLLPVTSEEYFKSFEVIENIVNTTASLNLTQLETIMFVYDVVKKRVFNQEDTEEEAYDSRDLTSSLLGDKIVCAGFNIIFDTILSLLGIKNTPIRLKDTNSNDGHVRTIIYVNDAKYNVCGHYFFDVTWDSKVNEKSQNSYRFFMKTVSEMINADRRESLYMEHDLFLYPNVIYKTFRELSDEYSIMDFTNIGGRTRFNQYLRNMGEETIEIKTSGNKKSELISAYKKIYDSFNNDVDPLEFAKLLYNVKKLEYYLDPSTPFSEDDLAEAIIGNTLSRFNRNEGEMKLISNMLGVSIEDMEKRDKEELLRATITPSLRRNIQRIKLTRSLREYSLKK